MATGIPEVAELQLAIRSLFRELRRMRTKREEEFSELRSTFADPLLLSEQYVEPDCQHVNPADAYDDLEPVIGIRVPVLPAIQEFLSGRLFHDRNGANQLFVLADAGMGKTSLLLILKLTNLTSFWPAKWPVAMFRIDNELNDKLNAISNKPGTILLLDALDEDAAARKQLRARLRELLALTSSFARVIITCRTHFFPEAERDPFGRPGRIVIEGFRCPLLYLSPFNDQQVEDYLRRRFPPRRSFPWLAPSRNKDFDRAARLASSIHGLRMRPLLLSYVEELLSQSDHFSSPASMYDALITAWLDREVRKRGSENPADPPPSRQELRNAVRLVAWKMQATGQRFIDREQLQSFLRAEAEQGSFGKLEPLTLSAKSLLNKTTDNRFRFSHFSIQEFLVAETIAAQMVEAAASVIRKEEFPIATPLVIQFLRELAVPIPIDLLVMLDSVQLKADDKFCIVGDTFFEAMPTRLSAVFPVYLSKGSVEVGNYSDRDRAGDVYVEGAVFRLFATALRHAPRSLPSVIKTFDTAFENARKNRKAADHYFDDITQGSYGHPPAGCADAGNILDIMCMLGDWHDHAALFRSDETFRLYGQLRWLSLTFQFDLLSDEDIPLRHITADIPDSIRRSAAMLKDLHIVEALARITGNSPADHPKAEEFIEKTELLVLQSGKPIDDAFVIFIRMAIKALSENTTLSIAIKDGRIVLAPGVTGDGPALPIYVPQRLTEAHAGAS